MELLVVQRASAVLGCAGNKKAPQKSEKKTSNVVVALVSSVCALLRCLQAVEKTRMFCYMAVWLRIGARSCVVKALDDVAAKKSSGDTKSFVANASLNGLASDDKVICG